MVPAFIAVAHSLRFASPAMTCSRRYFPASACGSSRVLKIGRRAVVLIPVTSSKKSARCDICNCSESPPSIPTRPAPANTCRVDRNGTVTRIRSSVGIRRDVR